MHSLGMNRYQSHSALYEHVVHELQQCSVLSESAKDNPDGMESEIRYQQLPWGYLGQKLAHFRRPSLIQKTFQPNVSIYQVHQSPRQSSA